MHSMDWDDIRYFLAAYRAGSTSRAARMLGVRHTTVGRRLAGLEEALGAVLFIRTPEGLAPTSHADAILALAEAAELNLAALPARVGGGDRDVVGMVRLTTSEAFADYLVRHLPELYDRYPGLDVEVLSSNRVFDLARGEADLAVRMTTTTQAELTCRKVGMIAWSLYAADSYVARRGLPDPPTDLAGHEVIGFDDSLKRSPGAEWLAVHARTAHVAFRGNSLGAILRAAGVGMGIAMVPCFMAASEPGLRRVSPHLVTLRGVWLVFHPGLAEVARIRAVAEFIAEIIRREAALLGGV